MDLRTLSLCTGGGGLDLGVRLASRVLGFKHRTVCYSEIEAYAAEVLVARIKDGLLDDAPVWSDLKTFDPAPWRGNVDLVTGGYPCFAGWSLVLTREYGYRPIDEIQVGDEVLTHLGRWRRVTAIMRREGAPLQRVSAQGSPDITTTPEHPFWAREQYKYGRQGKRFHRDPEWVRSDSIRGRFVGQVLPPEGSNLGHGKGFWWLVGRYLADGWRQLAPSHNGKGRVIICCSRDEADDLQHGIEAAGFSPYRTECRTTTKFHITRKSLYRFLEPFGHGAAGKTIPAFCYELPRGEASALLEGYFSGDGYRYPGGRRSTTVSKRLAHGVALLAQRAFGVVGSVRLQRVPETTEIEGRVVNQRPQWVIDIPDRNRSAFVDGDYGWKLVRKSEPAGTGTVYNIGVEEDESYVVENAIVHNCQPWSHAGRRRGADDPRHLWPYIAGIVRVIQPRFCFFENVDGHLSLGFREVRGELEEMGYRVEAGIFSAEESTAPHLRKRLFVLAHHRDLELHDGRRDAGSRWRGESTDDSGVVEHAPINRRTAMRSVSEGQQGGPGAPSAGGVVGHPELPGWGPTRLQGDGGSQGFDPERQGSGGAGEPGAVVGYPAESRPGRREPGSTWTVRVEARGPEPGGRRDVVADCNSERRQQVPGGPSRDEAAHGREGRHGVQPDSGNEPVRIGPRFLYPPGPDDHCSWLNLLAERGDLAPALPNLGARGFAEVLEAEPEIRRALDGVAGELDDAFECRTERLQMLGNGVVPIAAGLAFCVLARRAGLVE